MKHQQEVIEKIRRGETELVWEKYGYIFVFQANIFVAFDFVFNQSKNNRVVLRYTKESICARDSLEKEFGETRFYFESLKAASDCLQPWYNNFLLEEAKKLDQQS